MGPSCRYMLYHNDREDLISMELRDSVNGKDAGQSGSAGTPKQMSIDRVELKRQWVQQAEERQVEEALDSYARAAMQWIQSGDTPEPQESEEELEAKSQQLRLQQKCQDIAALMLAEELEDLDGEEE